MNILKQNSAFIFFLLRFFSIYFLLFLLYQWYLSRYDVNNYEVDGITAFVSEQTLHFIQWFENDAAIVKHDTESSYKFFYKGKYVSRIIEGCNSVSVIVLFAAFVFAFYTKLKPTLLYVLSGSFFIFLLNMFRIALLNYGLYYYPKYEDLLHNIIFPIIIYGIVLLLWIVWLLKFFNNAKKTN